jgi:acyl-CoA synthetase (AMP-forming)/AMP-acid ligase II
MGDGTGVSEPLTIGGIVAAAAERAPNDPAVIDDGATTTWAELDEETNRIANGLLAAGLRPGDRVATLAANGRETLATVYAIAKAGLVSVPLNSGLTAAELEFLIDDSRPQAIVADAALADSFAGSLAGKPNVFVFGEGSSVHGSLAELKRAAAATPPEVVVSPDDLRTVRYTSGTTSLPKACIGTHRQVLASIDNFLAEVPISGRYLCMLPLFTGVGIWVAISVARTGDATVMLRRFDAAEAMRLIEELGVSHTFAVPTMLSRIVDEYKTGTYDLSGLELIGYGGAPMPRPLIERAIEVLPCGFYQGYGGGEMGGLVSYLQPEDHASERIKSVGRVAKYATVKILDDDDNEVPTGEFGEVVVKSPSNFAGYWERPEETEATLRGEWVYTGDAGYFDEDGYLYCVDRKKDIVITGGMNVSSAEVEAEAMAHPAVLTAAVVGLPDEVWGESVTAAVVLRPGEEVSEAELIEMMRGRLAGYKTPKRIVFLDALPLNSAGKVLKRELRTMLSEPRAEV